ncbi:helix-turn-helix transcriptional regulator [Streptomyces sp. B-S-A8]|uniref:Helix-turn-helix transcriptional regulator n=1 Tax=Streptomyces solicavernae TaxID=3043614 RepID=A0ABT6RXN0_9ACTN|nr:helix-turn-helix transcriptional regulator [Streptomyces sp. B-S-A8]MDI3389196.1 helix-turn-helix transcriptional regulator [Streptomyces sp. B-S-A8]
MSENELGAYLRSLRESVTPADVGLPAGPRRRTPGLRRAELAMLAGISVEYLARLEQGRDRHPSAQVLASICDALQLPLESRAQLRHLLKAEEGHYLCGAAPMPAREVRPTVRALLDRLEPTPAVVRNLLGEAVAYTEAYARLMGPVGALDEDPPSLIRYVFTDPRARAAYPDWNHAADEQVAALHYDLSRRDPYVAELVEELTITAGTPFTDRIKAPSRLPSPTGVTRFVHPEVGDLRLAYETLSLPEADGQHVLIHLPADAATGRALDRLQGLRPGGLRAVGD